MIFAAQDDTGTRGSGQRNRKLGSLADGALHGDLAVGRVEDAAGDGQTEACAALAAPRGDERIEDAIDQLGRDSFAVVLHANDHPFSVFEGIDPDVAFEGPVDDADPMNKPPAKTNVERTSAGLQMILPGCERRTLPKSTSRVDEGGQGLLHFYQPVER